MKQRITVQQLNKLTDAQKEQLRDWWKPCEGDQAYCDNYDTITVHENGDEYEKNRMIWINCGYSLLANNPLPLMSIGQMIQFIQEKRPQLKGISKNRFDKWFVNLETGQLGYKDELCDALWETVTQILKQP